MTTECPCPVIMLGAEGVIVQKTDSIITVTTRIASITSAFSADNVGSVRSYHFRGKGGRHGALAPLVDRGRCCHKRLSQLVERVARGGGAPVAIGRYGRERALLVSAEEYRRVKTSTRPAKPPPTLEGTLTLECSPEELIAESRRLGDFWVASVDVAERKRRRSGWK